MAKITFDGFDDYIKELTGLEVNVEAAIKEAVYPAAAMVIEEIKANTPVDSGDLQNAFYLKKFEDKEGYVYTKVDVWGYDEKGVPNMLKARALESGTSRMTKRPFIRPAVNRVKSAAEAEIGRNFDQIISRIFKKG